MANTEANLQTAIRRNVQSAVSFRLGFFMVALCNRAYHNIFMLFMAALCNRAGHYIFALWFLSIFYLSSFMAALCNRAGHIYFHPVISCYLLFLFLA